MTQQAFMGLYKKNPRPNRAAYVPLERRGSMHAHPENARGCPASFRGNRQLYEASGDARPTRKAIRALLEPAPDLIGGRAPAQDGGRLPLRKPGSPHDFLSPADPAQGAEVRPSAKPASPQNLAESGGEGL